MYNRMIQYGQSGWGGYIFINRGLENLDKYKKCGRGWNKRGGGVFVHFDPNDINANFAYLRTKL